MPPPIHTIMEAARSGPTLSVSSNIRRLDLVISIAFCCVEEESGPPLERKDGHKKIMYTPTDDIDKKIIIGITLQGKAYRDSFTGSFIDLGVQKTS